MLIRKRLPTVMDGLKPLRRLKNMYGVLFGFSCGMSRWFEESYREVVRLQCDPRGCHEVRALAWKRNGTIQVVPEMLALICP